MATKTKSVAWFDENVSENQKELIEIGELANKVIHDKISLGLDNPKTTIAIYAKIFECICDELVDYEAEYSNFSLNIADRLRIGYTTTSNEDDEKSGNFMVFIQHINHASNDDSVNDDDDETNTLKLCSQWNAANVKVQSGIIKSISARGKKALSDYINIKTESHEFVIPLFCIIHDQIINYIRRKKIDLDEDTKSKSKEYELNVAGLYSVIIDNVEVSSDEETTGVDKDIEEDISFIPSISLKLRFKSDKIATGSNE